MKDAKEFFDALGVASQEVQIACMKVVQKYFNDKAAEIGATLVAADCEGLPTQGKSDMVKEIAEANGIPVVEHPATKDVDPADLKGLPQLPNKRWLDTEPDLEEWERWAYDNCNTIELDKLKFMLGDAAEPFMKFLRSLQSVKMDGTIKFDVKVILADLSTLDLQPVMASNPRIALSTAATRRYGPHGWELVADNTVMGMHVNRNSPTRESIILI